jgi:hypothetical protein
MSDKQPVKTIEIKGSLVKVSNLELPVYNEQLAGLGSHHQGWKAQAKERHEKRMEAFNASLVTVANPEVIIQPIKDQIHFGPNMKIPDGTYSIPDLLMEVRAIGDECGHPCNNYKDVCQFSGCQRIRNKVAFLSFASPKQS